ncbi:unnamed protein product [Allacma fusca]|uniref:DDE Tnp4 domain-containing protein n=1 Tax=Allacma fusca TaxID=39272 RepID=A0A8J2P186_9HEXA|nr:unnamed protein product [Allacma fusca]
METFENLRNLWGNSFETSKGRPCCDADRQLLLSIWTLANQESFRGIADRFDVERGLAHRIFTRFVKFIFSKRETFIKFPKGEEQQIHRRSFDLLRVQSFPGVVGCIDGCHIAIKQPMDDPQSYYNRKKIHFVILQGICDAKMQFIDVFAGWPGSSHDAHVWKNSPFFQLIAAEGGNNPMFPADCHLIGDSAYPLSGVLLTPYRNNGHLTATQKRYNMLLSSSRTLIEQAFGLLKCRWRRLKYLDMSNMELLPIVIVAACVLHNLCLLNDDLIEFDEIEEGWDDVNNAEEDYVELLGGQKRDLISQNL